jgi:ABC-type transport system substrate-binding protein
MGDPLHITTFFRSLLSSGMFLVFCLFIPGITGAEPAASTSDLTAVFPGRPSNLDPHADSNPAAWPLLYPSYHRLITFKGGSSQPLPSASVTWRISENGLIYTFVLKEGLTFSDGRKLDAQAVAFSFNRLMKAGGVGPSILPSLVRLDIVGPRTIRFYLNAPTPDFLTVLALPHASIVSPGLAEKPPDYLRSHTVGSGPYELTVHTDEHMELSLRPEAGSHSKIKRLTLFFSSDPGQRYANLLNKPLDLAFHVAPMDALRSMDPCVVFRPATYLRPMRDGPDHYDDFPYLSYLRHLEWHGVSRRIDGFRQHPLLPYVLFLDEIKINERFDDCIDRVNASWLEMEEQPLSEAKESFIGPPQTID